jgi:hypothetical protein
MHTSNTPRRLPWNAFVKRNLLFLLFLIGFTGQANLFAQGYVYYTNGIDIRRANLDMTNPVVLFSPGSMVGTIAVDPVNNKIYYEKNDTEIRRADFNGANDELFASISGGIYTIKLDVINEYVYWTASNGIVVRTRFDKTGGETLFDLTNATFGFDLNVVTGQVFILEQVTNKLKRSNLDGSSAADIATLSSETTSMDMYPGGGVMFTGGDKVRRINVNGSGITDIYTPAVGNVIGYVNVEPSIGKIFWSEFDLGSGTSQVRRANLDGSSVETIGSFTTLNDMVVTSPPEINLKQSTTNIASGGSYNVGSVAVGSNNATTFTIENLGGEYLNTSSGVSITGTHSGDFSVVAQPVAQVSGAASITFQIRFTPLAAGSRTATVTIPNSDANEGSYTFTITGTGLVPEINLKQGSTNLPSSSGSYSFGSVGVGSSSSDITFTVENLGGAPLNLIGPPYVALTGGNSGDFQIVSQPSSPIAGGANSTFQLRFNPSAIGSRSTTVTIGNSDSNENPYTFTITGTGLAPEINVRQASTNLPNGTGTHNFGTTAVGAGSTNVTFTIDNLGNSPLNLIGAPYVNIGGTHSSDFSLEADAASTIAGGSTTTFQLKFNPSAPGMRTATISIGNNDADEHPYTFTVTGTGQGPEINIQQNTTNIASGTGVFSMPSVSLGSGGSPVTFTIENTGNQDLSLTGNPIVAVSGTHASDFVVTTQPASGTVSSGANASFQVTFTPSGVGTRTATITIQNNDADEGTYTFTLNAEGTAEEINLRQNTTNIASGGTFDFGSLSINGATNVLTFTIENTGNQNLTLTDNPYVMVSGANASDFVVTTQPVSNIITAGSNVTFVLTFDPSATGNRSATLTIPNSDSDEGLYTVSLTGVGIEPGMQVSGNGNAIADGSTTPSTTNDTDFGSVEVSTQGTRTYTITNNGTELLQLTGGVTITGSGAANFNVIQPSTSQINPGQSITFDIQFNAPATPGLSEAQVSIDNNTTNTSVFDFKIQATAAVTVNAPSNITINANRLLVTLSWTDNSNNEDEFIIERSTDGISFSEIDRVTQNVTTYSDATVQSNTTYFYRIIASNAFNTGTSSVVNIAIGDVLSAPVNLAATASSDQIILTWEESNTSETGYAVYRALSSDPANFQFLFKTQPNEVSYIDVSVAPKTTYIYKLRAIAVNSSDNSDFSTSVTVTTQGLLPVPPSSLNATTLSQTEILIEWKDNASNETAYELYSSPTGDAGSFTLLTSLAPNTEEFIHAGLTSKTSYYYQLRANSTEGASTFTNIVTATTLSNVPEAPSELVVTPKSGSELSLEWVDNSSKENGFIVYRTTEQFGDFNVVDTVAANATSYADTGLSENTTYFYFVRAFNGDGNSEDRTNVASGKTANVPLVPVGVQVTPTGPNSITITWGVNTAPSTIREAEGYKVEVANILGLPLGQRKTSTFVNGRKVFRTTEDDLVYQQVAEVDASTRSVELQNLTANQKYIVRVRGYNANGNSPYSTATAGETLIDNTKAKPSAPSNLVTESVSRSEIDLTWQDNSSNELVFKIERKLKGEADWQEIGLVLGGTNTYSSIGLLPDTLYSYRVRASNEGGDSDYTNADSSKSECNLIVLVSNISGSNTICSGKSALLKVNTNVTDAIYQWKRNGVNIPNANLPIYNATRTGEYDCQIISGSCRKSSNSSLIIIVTSSFNATISITDSVTNTMEASVKGAQAYQWYRNYQPIEGAQDAVYQPNIDGTYFVVVTNRGCAATSNLITTSLQTTAVSNNALSKSVSVSPNPATNETVLQMSNEFFGKYRIQITDLQGRLLMVFEGTKQQTQLKRRLRLNHLAEGMYLVRVQIKGQESVSKLIKK